MNEHIQNQNRRKKSKGFTLMEILVAVAIVGILATATIAKFGGATTAATTSVTSNDRAAANSLLEGFEQSGGTFGATSTASQIDSTSAASVWADLRTGKTIGGITYSLPTTSSATVPSGLTWNATTNRF